MSAGGTGAAARTGAPARPSPGPVSTSPTWSGSAPALPRPGADGVLATADILDDLLLPGAPAGRHAAHEKWRGALHLPTVRGLVPGRSLLYPADGDAAAAVDTATALLREAE
ncbi:hypothetical protein VT52_026120 [Streptomyces malaysiense]|uniref:Cgl0159-like domain-containing protein n=1 Tax=Streptomyces malaysiense TaxID=1428626 RepID=A0A1J4PWH0_9ACTN|nr:hypothetical protein VT52_026120 [Streptomyces malaysiense]